MAAIPGRTSSYRQFLHMVRAHPRIFLDRTDDPPHLIGRQGEKGDDDEMHAPRHRGHGELPPAPLVEEDAVDGVELARAKLRSHTCDDALLQCAIGGAAWGIEVR